MTDNVFIAHVRQDKNDEWIIHDLLEHCVEVAKLASEFAGELGAEIAYIQGEHHDIGKYRKPFQERIRIKSGYDVEAHLEQKAKKASHSHAGAIQIFNYSELGVILAYTIAGHHTGLPNWIDTTGKCLHARLNSENAKTEYAETLENLPESLAKLSDNFQTLLPDFILKGAVSLETFHVWIRFLFSCLVDADFLDTELFMSPDKTTLRGNYPSIDDLHKRFWHYMNDLKSISPVSEINTYRQQILDQCTHAGNVADETVFALTVPTGGGKTLSSMAFALAHAKKFNKKRIIYAIPFTSIIEQNAQVFKDIFNHQELKNPQDGHTQFCVIEHHSTLNQPDLKETSKNRLACENWDAPIIVTTTVQLFESLFASRTSQCRKIHNIAHSVIVLDEAQKIPRDYQKPITDMMRELTKNYGVTWVLCTATQPKLDKTEDSFGRVLLEGLPTAYPIIKDEENLAERLKRVEIEFPKPNERLVWEEVAEQITQKNNQEDARENRQAKENNRQPCVLAIVNTRNDANTLYQEITALDSDALVIHLSASMCPIHRKLLIRFINQILNRYHQGLLDTAFYVVSTQLIEAGVDVDFPIVYRAMTGLDSIAQSAGRCNREGKLQGLGKVVVFQPIKDAPKGELLQAQQTTYEILDDIIDNPLSPNAFYKYFTLFNSKGNPDKKGISELLTAKREEGTNLSIAFRTASETFRLIDNNGVVSVICPFYHKLCDMSSDKQDSHLQSLMEEYPATDWLSQLDKFSSEDELNNDSFGNDDKINTWLTLLEKDEGNRWVYRKLQLYTVTVPKYILDNNNDMFINRAGLVIAKEYSFLTGIVCDFQPLTKEECVW